ncbi:uncharacterized protein LOC100843403 [Brachypodium distachyon]|uniref:Uncharacterized protein n=1 Tax=Brachypodium distachyon TaxID=15368 RepID=I1GKL3_BRADI|nr:uncharacterized protein LOC100843403 [Brachypodium distachyon]KQK11996.1 hypothetical protein BRADI_1g00880v3 [Brachypodium distachyon]|eukprot:XP_003559106.1 uncharacterized protein LOC100843403 [Brachypodium distachyon]
MAAWVAQSGGRGRSSWKHGWAARALATASLPPARLLAFFGIVVFFLAVSSYVDYRAIERRAEIGARVFAAPLALTAAFLVVAALGSCRRSRHGGWTLRRRAVVAPAASSDQAGSPWAVAAAVAVLLVMVSFQPAVHSLWFRPLWGSDYYS